MMVNLPSPPQNGSDFPLSQDLQIIEHFIEILRLALD